MAESATPVLDRRAFKLLIQQMSRALRDSLGGGLTERFEVVSKVLFTKMVDEREAAGRWNDALPKSERELAWRADDSDRVAYERARAVWQRAVSAHPRVFSGARAQFPKDVAAVARMIRLLEPVDLDATPNDIKGSAYEEILRNTFEKNENQQYFTPRHVVEFMVELCEPTDDQAVCDPATGSGGFLVGALNHVETRCGDLAQFGSRMRGAEVDERMAWIARINLLLHGGDPRTVFHLKGAASLAPFAEIRHALPPEAFDVILTNPPFGSDMTDRKALGALESGKGRQSRRRGILFVERCLSLLRPGGLLAIVLDDSVLNLPTNSDIRQLIKREADVEAVVSLPDVTFMPYSTAKSSIVVARRHGSAGRRKRTFMADVENVGNRPNGDPLYGDDYGPDGRRKLKSELPDVREAYGSYADETNLELVVEGTTMFSADIERPLGARSDRPLDVFFFHPARRHAKQRLESAAFPLHDLRDLVNTDGATVNPAQEHGDDVVRWVGLGDIEAQTGQYEVREMPGDRVKSSAHIFRGGDILFSPAAKLRKVVRIPDDDEGGFCSAELLVFRVLDPNGTLNRDYLSYLLRSDLVFGQLIYQVTGVGRPRVTADAVRKLQLPLPEIDVQQRLVEDLQGARAESLELRHEATALEHRAVETMANAYESVLTELCPPEEARVRQALAATR